MLAVLLADDLPELVIERPAWMADASCQHEGTSLFFPGKGESATAAKAICAACPARTPCLTYALETGAHGVWGGTTTQERGRMLHPKDHLLPSVPCAVCCDMFNPTRRNQVCCSRPCQRRWSTVVSARRRSA